MIHLEKDENIYHITWVTHNSRISERMMNYNVEKGKAIILNEHDKKVITNILTNIINEEKIKILRYIVNDDHVHLVLVCKAKDQSNIIRKLKGKITQIYKKLNNINDKYNLWAQKYNSSIIKSEKELENVIHYVQYNDLKHN